MRPNKKKGLAPGGTKASREANSPNNNHTIADIPAAEQENHALLSESRRRTIAPKEYVNADHNHRTEIGTEVRREYAGVGIG